MRRLKAVHIFLWVGAMVLAAWIVSRLPFAALLQSIAELTLAQWTAWVMLNVLVIVLFTSRWLVLTRAINLTPGFMSILMVRQAGQLISFVTPGPQFGGEPLQVYWLWKRYSVPGHAALLAVGLDRFYELWINLVVLLAAVILLLLSAAIDVVDWVEITVMLSALILMLSSLGWLMIRQPDRVFAWIKRLTMRWQHHSRLRNLNVHMQNLVDSLRVLVRRQKLSLLVALILSLSGWIGVIVELWLLLTFFNLTPVFFEFIFLFVAVRVAFLIPLPGGIGSLEASLYWAFQGLGLPVAAAAGLIVLMRLRDTVIMLIGLVVLRYIQSPACRLECKS